MNVNNSILKKGINILEMKIRLEINMLINKKIDRKDK